MKKKNFMPSKQDEVVFEAFVALSDELLTPDGKINLPELLDRIMDYLATKMQKSGDKAYVRHACEKLGLLQPLCGTCVLKIDKKVDKKVEVNHLPPMLATAAAMEIWKKAQEAGWIDDNYQLLISKAHAALLADYIGHKLQLIERWKPFAKFWHIDTLNKEFDRALGLPKSSQFIDMIKQKMAE